MVAIAARFIAVLMLVLGWLSVPAAAHPHVFVDARAEIVFDPQGRITAVRNIWQFDEAFTSYATLNLDANNDGQLSQEELEPLAKTNVESLAEFDFFTYLRIGDRELTFVPPTEYFLQFHGARLTLFYTLPLSEPAVVDAPAKLEVFDPEYFVAFSFTDDVPATLDGAPAGCMATFQPPGELDAQTLTILGQIPADQRSIPDDLVEAASVLANVITVTCPQSVAAAVETAASPAPQRPRPPSPFGVGTTDGAGTGWVSGPLGPFFLWISQKQAEFYKALTGTFADIKQDGRAAWLLILLSFAYGVFHAAGPGHGKAIITAYLFATGETVRRGIVIAFISAFVQALSAIAIVGVAAIVFRVAADTMTIATQWIEIASYALIVLVGLWLVWSKIRGGHHHHHHHHHSGDHTHPEHPPHQAGSEDREVKLARQREARWHDHAHHDHAHDHHGHSHAHHDHSHHHHAPHPEKQPPQRSLGGLISAVLAIGLRPCSGAIIILVFALSQGMYLVGIAATLVMAVGTGITVAALATLAVSARGFAERLAGTDSLVAYRIVRAMEITAAALVLLLGIVLLGGALAGGLPGVA